MVIKLKILHVLEHSIPLLAGYTIRSKYIVNNQKKAGIEPVVITSPLQSKTERELLDYETIDGVKYYRSGLFNKLDMSRPLPIRLFQRYCYASAYKDAIQKVCEVEKPDIIHAHSSYLNGNKSNKVGRSLKLPTVYEVRGLWGDTAVANEKIKPTSWKYAFVNYMDLDAMHKATAVIAISKLLKEDLIDKGVPSNKIKIVPNGIDTRQFVRQQKSLSLIDKHRLKGKLVLGFIGSIRKIEGLDLLIKVVPKVLEVNREIALMLIGNGDEVENLKNLSMALGISEQVIITGQIPFDNIMEYYSLLDILVYPRIDSRVNHRVTPLKPLEAMSMEKPVIASDVGGLGELIRDGENGLLFKVGSEKDLLYKIKTLTNNRSLMKNIGKNGRKWVVEERDWEKLTESYLELYRKILS